MIGLRTRKPAIATMGFEVYGSDDQPRDDNGRWTGGGTSYGSGLSDRATNEGKDILAGAIADAKVKADSSNLGFLMPAERMKLYESLGHSAETVATVQTLVNEHGSAHAIQDVADAAIAEHIKAMDAEGLLMKDMAHIELAMVEAYRSGLADKETKARKEFDDNWDVYGNKYAYDTPQQQWDTEEESTWRNAGQFMLYRKGSTSGDVQAWTTNSSGIPLGGGSRLGWDHKAPLDELVGKGMLPIAGISWLAGAPGESEVLMAKFK